MPTKRQSNPQKKPVRKIKVLQIKKSEQQSLFAEHFYLVLGILFCILTFFMMGFGMRWDESGVVSLWIVGIIFFVRQLVRSLKRDRGAERPEKKEVVLAAPVEAYKAPEVPRVSKDFSPMPPAGDKRYPPPSPFIRPPK